MQITPVNTRNRRYRKEGGSTLSKANTSGYVDGHNVSCTEGKGWRGDCPHVDAMATPHAPRHPRPPQRARHHLTSAPSR